MKKQLMTILAMLVTLALFAQNVRTVHLDGTSLEKVLGDDVLNIESIAITGKIMEPDYRTLAKALALGHLRDVDLSGCVSQGDTLFRFCYSDDNYHAKEPWNIKMPQNIKVISIDAFKLATVNDISIPSSVRTLEQRCFQSGTIVNNLYIEEGLDSIGMWAFRGTRMPRNVYLPASLRIWAGGVFLQSEMSSTFTNIWFRGEKPPFCVFTSDEEDYGYVFDGTTRDTWTLHVPKGSKRNYEDDPTLSFMKKMKIVEYTPATTVNGKTVRSVDIAEEGVHLYDAISKQEAVTLDSIVVTGGELNENDFYFLARCSEKGKLSGVDLSGATVHNNEIPDWAFRLSVINGAPKRADSRINLFGHLQYIRLPRNINRIGEQAFFMTGLKTIDIPNTVSVIDTRAFGKCEDLREVRVFNADPSTIDARYAFDESVSKATLIVPVGAKSAYMSAEAWKYFGRIVESSSVDGINTVVVDNGIHDDNIYTLDGKLVGTDIKTLPKGIYVVDGKKMVK